MSEPKWFKSAIAGDYQLNVRYQPSYEQVNRLTSLLGDGWRYTVTTVMPDLAELRILAPHINQEWFVAKRFELPASRQYVLGNWEDAIASASENMPTKRDAPNYVTLFRELWGSAKGMTPLSEGDEMSDGYGEGIGNGKWAPTEWDLDLASQLLPDDYGPALLHSIVCFRLECEKAERERVLARMEELEAFLMNQEPMFSSRDKTAAEERKACGVRLSNEIRRVRMGSGA